MYRTQAWPTFAPPAPFLPGLRAAVRAARSARVARAWRQRAEIGSLLRDPIYWGIGVPRGDGHPVLVLPGLFAGDRYLTPLRRWLRRAGYAPVRSGLERNPGWSEELVERLSQVVQREHQRTGRRVTIIGHSMGGLIGRSVAVRYPGAVRQVITLAAPLAAGRGRLPASVPLTAVVSRDDRIVRPSSARPPDPKAKTIEVGGSHSGLAANAEVYRLLARLLPAGGDSDADARATDADDAALI
jgi:pimeloyl-ACP methyl ester carboxylesterase